MLNAITQSQIYVLDQDEALDFYVGKLGLEVSTDLDLGFMRWLTVHVPGHPDRQILLEKPGPPAMDDATAEQVRDLLTKGAMGGWLIFTPTTARRPTTHCWRAVPSSTRNPRSSRTGSTALRDPFGNNIRIGEVPADSAMS